MSNLQHKRDGSFLWQQVSRALMCRTQPRSCRRGAKWRGGNRQMKTTHPLFVRLQIPSVALWRLRAFPLWSACSANGCIPAGPLKFRGTSCCGGVHSSISDCWGSPDEKLYSGGLPRKQKTSLLGKWWWATALWKKWWGIIKVNNTTQTWWPLKAFWFEWWFKCFQNKILCSHKKPCVRQIYWHQILLWKYLRSKFPQYFLHFYIWKTFFFFFDKLFRFEYIPHV